MGLDRALKMTLLHEVYPAAEALKLGLVTEVVPAGELQTRTLEFARAIAKRAPLAVRLAKNMMRKATGLVAREFARRCGAVGDDRQSEQGRARRRRRILRKARAEIRRKLSKRLFPMFCWRNAPSAVQQLKICTITYTQSDFGHIRITAHGQH